VEIPYSENRPGSREYVAIYDVETRSPDQAIVIARKRFNSYENYNSASWVRTISDERIKVSLKFGDLLVHRGDIAALMDSIKKFSDSGSDEFLSCAVDELREHLPLSIENILILLNVFEGSCESARLGILMLLINSGGPLPVERILALFNVIESRKVLATYVKLLARVRDEKSLDIICNAMTDTDSRVRANAVEALEISCGTTRLDALFPLLEDSNNRVRANAIKAIYNLCGADMITHIDRMVGSPDKWMRASVAYALSEIDIEGRCHYLLRLLDDSESSVRINAARSMNKVCDGKILPEVMEHLITEHLVDEDDEVKRHLKEILVRHATSSIDILIGSLREKNLSKDLDEVIERIKTDNLNSRNYMTWLKITLRNIYHRIFS
jgi:hypothetical protein